MPRIFDQNPNQQTGGTGCLYVGERASKDCAGPYIELEGRVFGPMSPRPVICAYHAGCLEGDVERAVEKGQVQRLPGRSRREGVPNDPRRKGRRPAATDQQDAQVLTGEQLAEVIKPKRGAKPAPAAKALVTAAVVDDTPDI